MLEGLDKRRRYQQPEGGCLIALLIVVAVPFLSYQLFVWQLRVKTEKRIIKSLETHYKPAEIRVLDRLDQMYGDRWESGGQVCFLIVVRQSKNAPAVNKVAMIRDDDDGGAFYFNREYSSMEQCRSDWVAG